MLLLTYPFLRSTIENFRGDTVRGTDWLGLFSTSQLVSIPTLLVGATIFALRLRSGVAEETPYVEEEE